MSQKKCPSCNANAPAKSKFCPECGSALSKKNVGKTNSAKSNAARDTLILVAVLVIATTGYFMFNKPAPVPAPPPQQQFNDPSHENVEGMGTVLGDLPTDYNTLIQIGNQTMDQGNFPMAAECYKRALSIKEDSPNIRTDYGACLHGMGLPERAIEEFMTVIKKYPNHTIANFNLGIVYYSINDIEKAKSYFEKFLSIESSGPTADAARKYLKEISK